MKRYTVFPLVSGLYFLLATNIYSRYYYFIVCTPFLLFGVIGVVYMLKDYVTFQRKEMEVCVAIALVAVCSLLHIRYWHLSDQRFNSSAYFTQLKNNPIREEFYFNANLIKSKNKAKILYLRGTDVGYGILSESLPACRYWIRQNGETKEMYEDQYLAVKRKLADVIVVKRSNHEDISICKQSGYKQYEYNSESETMLFIK
jgi:hypothetical protein